MIGTKFIENTLCRNDASRKKQDSFLCPLKFMKNYIGCLVFYSIITITFVMCIGCAGNGDSRYDWEEELGSSILKDLEEFDHLTGGHVMPDLPVNEPKMAKEDREYLDEKCNICHDLTRVFRTSGTRSLWEQLLGYQHHLEIELEPEKKEKLLGIFQKYLSNPDSPE